MRSAALEGLRNRALACDMVETAVRLGARLKRAGAEWTGPCPFCGGDDRFSINVRDRVFNCRGFGGGDIVAMTAHITGDPFARCLETITGERLPDSDRQESEDARAEREAHRAAFLADLERRNEEDKARARIKRLRDEEAIEATLANARAFSGSQAAAYLERRVGYAPAERMLVDLRMVDRLAYWGFASPEAETKSLLATLPAMIGVIRDIEGQIIGLHETYLDPGGAPAKWKPSGDLSRNKAKKMRGVAAGGLVRLGRVGETLAIAEGIETAFAWFGLERTGGEVSLASANSLGGIAGRATGSRPHPTLIDEKAGRPIPISNSTPSDDGSEARLPEHVREVIILGDGDSERVSTRVRLLTAVRRWRAEGRTVLVDMAPDGQDWADVAAERQRQDEGTMVA